MTEERKFAILFAATILAARKLIDLDTNKPNMAKGFFVDRAIEDAAFILERIAPTSAQPEQRRFILFVRYAEAPAPIRQPSGLPVKERSLGSARLARI